MWIFNPRTVILKSTTFTLAFLTSPSEDHLFCEKCDVAYID